MKTQNNLPPQVTKTKTAVTNIHSGVAPAPIDDKIYQKIIAEMRDYAILLLDTEGNILNWNPGAESIKGYAADEIIGKNFRVFYSAEDRNNHLPESLLSKAREEGKATHEGWRIKKDGNKFWGSIVITALHNAEQQVIGFSKVTRDLSDRKAAEEKLQRHAMELEFKHDELRRSEDRYHRMIAEIEDYAIILLDPDGKILNWNRGAQNIKGYRAEEIVGRNFSVFYRQEDVVSGLPNLLINQARTEGKASHEGWRVKKDGTTFWGSIVITALHDTDHNVIGFSKVTRDLTERKMAEERQQRYTADLLRQNELLQLSEERYHRMIAEVEDYAIILLDLQGNVLNWNKGAQKIKGYMESEIVGKNFKNFYLPEDQKNRLPEELLEKARRDNKATHEGWRVCKDGSRFWGSILITALHDREGNITGFSKVTRDLTQKKHFEDYILMQNQQLEEYAYIVSHDLQEPLRKIIFFNNLIKSNLTDTTLMGQYLDKIEFSTIRMSNLIGAVLEYSRMGGPNVAKTTVNLTDVLRSLEADYDLLLTEKKGKLIYGPLPSVVALPIQMHQLFSNLVGNAIKFSEAAPEITITAEHLPPTSQQTNLVKVTVADNGIGFNPEFADKIFKMFHRLHDHKSGTGIGLALCKRIVENHGGSISAVSQPGKGTTITVLLPAAQ